MGCLSRFLFALTDTALAFAMYLQPQMTSCSSSVPLTPGYLKAPEYLKERRQRRQRLHGLHCYLAQTGMAAVSALPASSTDSAPGREELASPGAWLREAMLSLADAIGKQVRQLARVCDRLGIPVLCYWLRTDFQGEPFDGEHVPPGLGGRNHR